MARSAISIYFLLSGLLFSSWASRIPEIKDRFSLTEAGLGAMLFMLPLGALVALPFAGWIVLRVGSKKITLISLLVYALLLLLIAFSSSRWQLSFTLFFYGVIGNIANISMNTQGLSIQTKLNRPILSGLHAMWSLGAFFAAALTGWAIKWNLTMSAHYATVTALTIIVVLAMAAHLIADVQREGVETKVFVLPNQPLMLLGIICFCVAMSEGAMADWSSLYYRGVIHDASSVSTAAYTAFMMCMTLGRFAGDRLLQSLTHQQVLKLNGLLIFLGMLLALSIQQPHVVMVGFGLVGFGVSSVIPIVYILSAKTKSMPPSTALAAVSSVGFSGFLFGPPLIGFAAQETGLRAALLIVALLGALIWWLSFRIR